MTEILAGAILGAIGWLIREVRETRLVVERAVVTLDDHERRLERLEGETTHARRTRRTLA